MVEVDPKLFVTCRLCLDVEGQFQIVPSVQEHIKYCFDINVKPFDRLPQLICKKCDGILKEYYAIKKKFIEKQEELKAKVQNNEQQVKNSPLPQQDETDSSTNEVKIIRRKRKHKTKKGKIRKVLNRFLSSSNDDLDEPTLFIPSSQTKQKCSASNGVSAPWDTNFTKYYCCRICSRKFNDLEEIKEHIDEHIQLRTRHKNIFNTSCLVVMEKFDGKPNFTNCHESVVYSSDCILQNKHNPYYYTVYNPKKNYNITNNEGETKNRGNSESSDSEILTRKRIRLLSRSSGETIIIHRNCRPGDDASKASLSKNHQQAPTVIDCIDIESSENESDNSNIENKSFSNKVKDDPKSIHNIVKMCNNRYVKRIDCVGRNKLQNNELRESFLQHKVLSIGRKIINNKGFNCTGILRFLEYKDLNVIWKETNMLNTGTDGKFIQIATRMRGSDNSDENSLGWKNFNQFPLEEEISKNSQSFLTKVKNISQLLKKSNAKKFINEDENIYFLDNLPRISSVFSQSDLEVSKTTESDNMLKRLLNQSPVSNPKQLPKKSSESSTLKITKVFSAANKISAFDNQTATNENIEFDRSMPIIVSSVSLTPVPDTNMEMSSISTCGAEDSVSNNEPPPVTQLYYPRIKVKPVSELMPEKPQNYINTINDTNFPKHNDTQNTLACNNGARGVKQWPSQNFCSSEQQNCQQLIKSTSQSFDSAVAKDYIILDTVEFPNTRTNSPFNYLQNLLLVHNITLLDSDTPLSTNSTCLIKLKVVFQQEKCQSVTLCQSLYCCDSMFSIKVQDVQLREANINKFSANWQWQLLKIYNNEVAAKVLPIASRINEKTYDCTKTFFTLLNSIKNVQEVCYVSK